MSDDTRPIANQQARDQKKEAYLRAIHDRYAEQFRMTADQDAISVARATHAAMDVVLERDRQKDADSSGIRSPFSSGANF